MRKVRPLVTCESTLPRAAVKVLLCPVEREQEAKERMVRNKEPEFHPRLLLCVILLTIRSCETDKARVSDF